jgi:WD40 repeat protein
MRFSVPKFSEFHFGKCRTHFVTNVGNEVAIIDSHSSFLAVVDLASGNRRDLLIHKSDILCLAQHKELFVTSSRDAVIQVFSTSNVQVPLLSIPLYRDEILCCAVNSDFGVIASGTRDGFMILSAFPKGSTTQIIDLEGCRPVSLLITDGWGFVVVFMKKITKGELQHFVAVYSVNGFFLRKKLVGAISAWTSYCAPDGFDHLVWASDTGKLMSCEAFYLDVTPILGAKVDSAVVALRYARTEMGVVAVCRTGEALFFPTLIV